jgi:hypothetical protein
MKKLSAYLFGSIFLIYSCKETFQSEAVKKNISFWGDSMTAGSGGNGVTMPDVVKDELKRKVFNGGVAGLSSNNIARRFGFYYKIKRK